MVPASAVATHTEADIARWLCHTDFGVGSDGLLIDYGSAAAGVAKLRIFNPDGSEAETSGNGLRIFARYLFDADPALTTIVLQTPFAKRRATKLSNALIKIEMGTATIAPAIKSLTLPDQTQIQYLPVSMGNPHCVVLGQPATKATALALGPSIETHANFPNRTNVQFLERVDQDTIKIEIWERGAGYTLSSGSSSCAAAAAANQLQYVKNQVTVQTCGGLLNVDISNQNTILLTGSVTPIASGNAFPPSKQAL